MKNQRQFFQGLFGDSSCLITTFHHYFTTTHLTCLLSHCCCSPSYPLSSQVEVEYIVLGFCRDNSAGDGNKEPCAQPSVRYRTELHCAGNTYFCANTFRYALQACIHSFCSA